jgi:hypothetical protein
MAGVIRVLAAVAFAGATGFNGTAQQLAPPTPQSGFTHVLASRPAKQPHGALGAGFKSGWAVIYQKGTTKSPVEALLNVYVYKNAAQAGAAYTKTCTTCSAHVVARGVSLKFGGGSAVQAVATCHNVFASVIADGSESTTKLVHDAGFLAGVVFGRAVGLGMPSCKT